MLAQSAGAQFQAQNGWGLPRQLTTSAVTQGLVVDTGAGRVAYADQAGIKAQPLDGSSPTTLVEQIGVRNLVGTGGGASLALAWYARSLTDTNAVWGWFKGQARKIAESENQSVAVTLLNGQPLVAFIGSQGDDTTVNLWRWGSQRPEIAYRTKLNVGALALEATPNGRIAVFFAEGFRNAQDEKYDAVLLEGTPALAGTSALEGAFKRTRVGAAVYTGREQRYAVAVRGERLMPVWWFESDEDQRIAALTKRHRPRLAIWDGTQARGFAPPGDSLGQIGNAFFYNIGTDINALDLSTFGTTRAMIAPRGINAAAVAQGADGVRYAAWQSIEGDGFTSSLWVSDSRIAYQPTTLDRISVAFGWNPWYAVQSALGQVIIAVMAAAGAVMLTAPFVWLLSARLRKRIGLWAAVAIGAAVVVLIRAYTGTVSLPDWGFAPLLTPPWWTVALGVALGAGLVWTFRRRLQATELSPTLASSLVVLSGVFIMVFSRAGFLRY
jgi:hypothetical protein